MDAYVFPGQGSQYVGMGQEWYSGSAAARDVFACADRYAESRLGVALSTLCFNGPAELLDDTQYTQPAMFVADIAALRALEERAADSPAYVAGHSLGEFSALVASGVLAFEDALYLVVERARLMKQAGTEHPGGMAAILGLEREAVERICAQTRDDCGEYVGIANDNCPGQIVISGTRIALAQATELARAEGAKRVVPLAVSIAAHSPLMAQAAEEFRHLLRKVTFRAPGIAYVSNTTACAISEPEALRETLGQQLTSPVRWQEAVRWMIGQGVTRFIEVGPKDVLSGLVRRIDRTVEVCHVNDLLSGQTTG